MNLMVPVLCLIAAIFLRSIPRILWGNLAGTDVHYHLWYIRLIRENGHRLPAADQRIVGPGVNTYPAFYHWLLSYVPSRGLVFIDRHFGLAFDLINSGTMTWALFEYFDLNLHLALLFGALYLIAPNITFSYIGPRAFALTPRNWSQTLTTMYLLAILLYLHGQPAWLLVIGVLLMALALLSSKFAVQCFIPIAVATGFMVPWQLAFWVILCPPFLSLVLSRGRFVAQLTGQLLHLEWYLKNGRHFIAERGNWSALWEGLKSRSLNQVRSQLLIQNPFTNGLMRNPLLPFALYAGFLAEPAWPAELRDAVTWAGSVCLALAVAWVLTCHGKGKILGESERYLEFSFPLQIVLISGYILNTWFWLGLSLTGLYFLALYLIQFRDMHLVQLRTRPADIIAAAAHLNNYPDATVVALKINDIYTILNNSPVNVCGYNGQMSIRGGVGAFMDEFIPRYPILNSHKFNKFGDRYGASIVLARKADLVANQGIDYYKPVPLPTEDVLYENETVILHRL